MQATAVHATRRAPRSRPQVFGAVKPTPPPIIWGEAMNAEPHPIYGTTPIGRDGFTLEKQNIHMLNFWHERAIAASNKCAKSLEKAAKPIDGDALYDLLYNCKWEVFEAAFKIKISSPSEVAKLLLMISRQVAYCGDIGILTVEQLQYVAKLSETVSQPLRPTKRIGALQRGRLLTRAGLLHRYHAFLIQELETLSGKLYGSRDYAMQYCPTDRAVTIRRDENNLPRRARSVLKSLSIDTKRTDDVPVGKARKGRSR